MNTRRTPRHLLAAVLIGVLVGGGLMAVTPAGAEVAQVATNWKKIWKKQLRPQADKRYYKKSASDAKYSTKTETSSALANFYTKADADARYQPKGNYAPAGSSYTKAEIDEKLAPFVNSVAAISGGEQSLSLTPAAQVVRSVSLMPPANGKVIVSASGAIEPSAAGIFRCSITTGSAIDYNSLQVLNGVSGDYLSLGATRGYNVTKGSLFTVNYVCDEWSGEATLRDGNLTAIFAPN